MATELYIATYSNVDVYECFIEGVPLMRRVKDDWINATQILKAAKYPKAHRTRILEKEVQNGTHEKIQGGYGRFQGTWVPIDIARPFAHRYGITDEIAPILTFVPDSSNPIQRKVKTKPNAPNATVESDGTPVKRPRKQYNTKKRREAAAAAAAAEANSQNQALTNGGPRGHSLPPINTISADNQNFWQAQANGYTPNSAPSQFPQNQLQAPPQLSQFKGAPNQNGYHQRFNAPYSVPYNSVMGQQFPQQQAAPQPQLQVFPHQHQQQDTYPYQQHKSRGSQENWSQDDASTHMDDGMKDSDTSVSSDHSAYKESNKLNKASYQEALIEFISNESDVIPQLLRHPPSDFDFNEPIDEDGHTSLHWASSMASTGLIELLIKNGSDPLVPNAVGLNCLSRAIFFNNSYQKKNFHILCDLMKHCLYTPDRQGRTPLHYLAASNSSKALIARYYAEKILERLRQENDNLVKIVVNHKDINGETAIELAQNSNNQVILDVFRTFTHETTHAEDKDVDENQDTTFNHDETMQDAMSEIENYNQEKETKPEVSQEAFKTPSVPTLPLKEVGPILTSMLSSLADAYDTELKNKEEESRHTELILSKLKTDVRETESQNNLILSQLDNGNLSYDELQVTVRELEDSCSKKSDQLNSILERSQALRLAKSVLKEESAVNHEHSSNENDNNVTQYQLACELTQLQLKRNKIIETIINELATRNINNKMNSYRRLISVSCGLKTDDIDELIDEIEADLLTTVSTIE